LLIFGNENINITLDYEDWKGRPWKREYPLKNVIEEARFRDLD
jgi:hypothetical protein